MASDMRVYMGHAIQTTTRYADSSQSSVRRSGSERRLSKHGARSELWAAASEGLKERPRPEADAEGPSTHESRTLDRWV
jgi:hypothetical protein